MSRAAKLFGDRLAVPPIVPPRSSTTFTVVAAPAVTVTGVPAVPGENPSPTQSTAAQGMSLYSSPANPGALTRRL